MVVVAVEGWFSVAVMVVVPPLSVVDVGERARVTSGESSSRMVRAAPVTVGVAADWG